jgi:hypothetical protein
MFLFLQTLKDPTVNPFGIAKACENAAGVAFYSTENSAEP